MEDQPKADVSKLQEIDLQNIKDYGRSNNLIDEPQKGGYQLINLPPESELLF